MYAQSRGWSFAVLLSKVLSKLIAKAVPLSVVVTRFGKIVDMGGLRILALEKEVVKLE